MRQSWNLEPDSRRTSFRSSGGEKTRSGLFPKSVTGAFPILTRAASASEQFSGRGGQEVMGKEPNDMEGCFPHTKASTGQRTLITYQRINMEGNEKQGGRMWA